MCLTSLPAIYGYLAGASVFRRTPAVKDIAGHIVLFMLHESCTRFGREHRLWRGNGADSDGSDSSPPGAGRPPTSAPTPSSTSPPDLRPRERRRRLASRRAPQNRPRHLGRRRTLRRHHATCLRNAVDRTTQLRPRTRAHYESMLERLILPDLGDAKLVTLTPAKIRQWHTELGADHPTRNAHAYALLHAICATAVQDEVLDANPCRIRAAMQPTGGVMWTCSPRCSRSARRQDARPFARQRGAGRVVWTAVGRNLGASPQRCQQGLRHPASAPRGHLPQGSSTSASRRRPQASVTWRFPRIFARSSRRT